jgi:restriction endonuclease
MVEIKNMFTSSFLLTNSYSQDGRLDDTSSASIQGEFLKVLKSFLNLIYNPVLVKHDMVQEQQEVQNITIQILLKNAAILKDVWSALDKKKRQQIGQ